jgi:hypothetical protein
MIYYTKSGVRVAELFFGEETQASGVDLVRYQHFPRPVPGTHTDEYHTIELDLSPPPDAILAQMRSHTRHKIRRAEKMDFVCECSPLGDREWLEQFLAFWDGFAPTKRLPRANRERLEGMRAHGQLDLSRVRGENGEVLVWHCAVKTGGRVRLVHSASLFRELDSTGRSRNSHANAHLHWQDMLRLQKEGIRVYDFGGWYSGRDNQELLNVNHFKEGFGGAIVPTFNTDDGRTLVGVLAVYARQALAVWRGYR